MYVCAASHHVRVPSVPVQHEVQVHTLYDNRPRPTVGKAAGLKAVAVTSC